MEKVKAERIQANIRGKAAYIFTSAQKKFGESQAVTLNMLLLELDELRQEVKELRRRKLD